MARAGGDLKEAERMEAEDRLQMETVDDDGPGCLSSQAKPSNCTRRLEDDAVIAVIQGRFAFATAELTALKEAMTSTEPDNILAGQRRCVSQPWMNNLLNLRWK